MNVITVPATQSMPAGAIITLEPHEQYIHPHHIHITVTAITVSAAGAPQGTISFQGHVTNHPEEFVDLSGNPATRGRITISEFLNMPPYAQRDLIPSGQVRGVLIAAVTTSEPHTSRALPPVTSLQEFKARTRTRAGSGGRS